MPPPAVAGSNSRPSVLPVRKAKPASMCTRSPIAPSATSSSTSRVCGWKRYMNASTRQLPVSRATSTMVITWPLLGASGFSHSTCLPARSARIVRAAWAVCTVET